MTSKVQCKIYLAMNENGDWIVTADDADALNDLGESYGGNSARVVKLTVSMTPPEMSEVEVDVPDEAGSASNITATAA